MELENTLGNELVFVFKFRKCLFQLPGTHLSQSLIKPVAEIHSQRNLPCERRFRFFALLPLIFIFQRAPKE